MDQAEIIFVLFDGGGVLYNGIPSPMLRELAKTYGNNENLEEYQVQELQQKIATANHLPAVRAAWWQLKTNPNYTEQMYWQVLIETAGLRQSVQECMQLVRETMRVNGDVMQLAKAISCSITESGQKRNIGIVSNHATDWFNEYARKGDVYSVFPRQLVVISQEVSCCKPDFSIFEAAMQRIYSVRPNTKPEEVIFFDDKQSNIEAARQFGWKAELFDNSSQGANVLQEHLFNHGVVL